MNLYKYLKPERVDVLENLKIRYTQAYVLNDPFDSYPGVMQKDKGWYKRQFLKQIENDANQYTFGSRLSRNQYISARKSEFESFYLYHTDEVRLFEKTQSIIRLDSAVQGYLSLSATNKSILMWSHYAQNHEGFVISYNKDHQYFNYGLMKVQYKKERPFLDSTQSKQDASLFYTKSIDWRYEEEYRKSMSFVEPIKLENGNTLLPFPKEVPGTNDKSLYEVRLFDFPKDCISSIIVGWKSNPDLLNKIRDNLRKHKMDNDVKIFKAIPHKFKYEMIIQEI